MKDKYILKNRVPVVEKDLFKWGKWVETEDMNVDQTEINNINISTIFLGLDHNHERKGEPLLFETMIFGSKKYSDYQQKYSTWEEAEEGHKKAVNLVKKED